MALPADEKFIVVCCEKNRKFVSRGMIPMNLNQHYTFLMDHSNGAVILDDLGSFSVGKTSEVSRYRKNIPFI